MIPYLFELSSRTSDTTTQNRPVSAFEKYYIAHIPEKLDIDLILVNNPPHEISVDKKAPIRVRDKLVWILNNILVAKWSARKKGKKIDKGWVSLYSGILNQMLNNYKEYLNYLCRVDIIECDESYSNHHNNKESKKYRFTDKYFNNRFKEYYIYDINLIRRINNAKIDPRVLEKYRTLYRWFKELDYDEDKAIDILKELYNEEPWRITSLVNMMNNRIRWNQGNFSIAESNRLFNPICNINKELRKTLRYRNKGLVEIDIKNSIPFMALCLFDYRLLRKKNEINEIIDKYIKNRKLYVEVIEEYYGKSIGENKNKVERITSNDKYTGIPNMFCDLAPPPQDIQDFANRIMDGTIYSHVAEYWSSRIDNIKYNRKSAKTKLLSILNSPNFLDSEERSLLSELYPRTMDIINIVNTGYSKIRRMRGGKLRTLNDDDIRCPFAMITQSIEAYFVLDICCARINEEYPAAPIFTIHDSILTTVEYSEQVKDIMLRESDKLFGRKCQLHVNEL